MIEDYDNARKQYQEVTQTLTSENQKLNNQCESLTSLLEEERQAHSNTASKLEELDQQLDVETRNKVCTGCPKRN